jgi:transposase
MGQVLHGGARTTEAVRRAIQLRHIFTAAPRTTVAVRRAIQLRQESVRALARRHGVSPTTVQKWRKRETTADAKMGPKQARSTVLTPEEEAAVVAFRRHTLLPLDDRLYGLQPTIPHLTRSALHRCLQRHGIGRLPEIEGDKPEKKRFATYAIGYFHIDLAEVSTGRASCVCSWPSTARASSPSSASWTAQGRWRPRSSCATWSRPCPTASTPC